MSFSRLLDLLSIPFRLGAALGLSYLAYTWPWLAAALLAVTVAISLAGFSAYVIVLRAMRHRGRVACRHCQHLMLPAAKICPACHTPALAARFHHIPAPHHATVLEAAVAMIHADDRLDDRERAWFDDVLERADLDPPARARLSDLLDQGCDWRTLALPHNLDADVAEAMLDVLALVMISDGELAPDERACYAHVGKELGLSWWARYRVLTRHRDMM